jgi:uncharacterized phage protein (TIGR02218 family)
VSFDTLETSVEDGKPIFLYRFTLGSVVWRYTSAAKDLLVGADTYEAVAISHDGVKLTGEASTDALTIQCPVSIGPVQVHFGTPPATPIQVAILRKHDDNAEVVTVYVGEISQVGFPLPGQARITCETLSVSMQREGLRLSWQRGCPYALYDPLTCKVDKTLFAVSVTVLSVSGFEIVVDTEDAMADGRFNGGFMEWSNLTRGMEFRGIESQVSTTIQVFGMTDDIYPGLVMTIYPGCARTKASCVDKFNNFDNYGGVINLPGKSPFDGTPLF